MDSTTTCTVVDSSTTSCVTLYGGTATTSPTTFFNTITGGEAMIVLVNLFIFGLLATDFLINRTIGAKYRKYRRS
jgi:hypothetical protein